MGHGNNANMLATEQAMPAKKLRLSVKIAATVLILVAVAGFFEAEAPIALPVNDALKIHPVRPQSTYIIPREFNH